MGVSVSITITAVETDAASCPVLPLIPDITAMGAEEMPSRSTGSGPTKAEVRISGRLTVGQSIYISVNRRVFKSALR